MEVKNMLDTKENIVVNWFSKDHLEALINKSLTSKDFDTIRRSIDDSNLPDELSNLVREYIETELPNIGKEVK